MPSIEELGKAIKQAHPGQYDDLDDKTAGNAVKSAHPQEYADFTESSTRKVNSPFEGSTLSKFAGPAGLAYNALAPQGVKDYVGETVGNILPSLGKLVMGAPELIGKASDYVNNLIQHPEYAQSEQSGQDVRDTINNVISSYKQKLLHPLDTIRTDPAGTAADLSILGRGLGLGARAIAGATALPGAIRTGELLTRAGQAVDPVQATGRVLARVSAPARQAIGEHLYGGTLKLPSEAE